MRHGGKEMKKTCFLIMLLGFSIMQLAFGGPTCTITSESGVAFGKYDVLSSSALTSTSLIKYNCIRGITTVTIKLSPGNSGNFTPRKFLFPAGLSLQYNLYLGSAY